LAKRGRRPKTTSLLALVQQLNSLDAQRQALLAQIRAATNALSGGAPDAAAAVSAAAGAPAKRRGGRRKGFKMSAEARAKISAAAKKRWAARKKADKG
jgi:hypothetical protein